MKKHFEKLFSIYFADDQLGFPRSTFESLKNSHEILAKISISLNDLVYLKQIHSNIGSIIDDLNNFKVIEGDYLITQKSNIGLAVYTADCLPIIFFDSRNNAIAIAHAGWRGSVEKVGLNTIAAMKDHFGSFPKDIKVFFGPCARVCCYEVGDDFVDQIKKIPNGLECIIYFDNKIYFDLVLFNTLQLNSCGIEKEHISFDYNLCTICNRNYCSIRRQGKNANRQITIVALNS